ncbi:MFS transporter [Nonomuraea sp. N2-4H]|uniref:MFS transporter n=1 Tax=Nonomuraea sp. N2-4H TaxID=3128898 RepID=UPI0032546C68
MRSGVPATMGDIPRLQAQRRALIVLVTAQILSGLGLAAGVTVGALLAQDVFGSTGLAGLPSAVGTAGAALAAVAIGRLSQARGRRSGLAAGYLAGAAGSAGVIAGAVVGSAFLLLIALFVYGAGTAANLLARYAGVDLAAPAHRARAVSIVLVATTLGGVAGPNLAAPFGDVAAALGVPELAGPFLLSGAAYAVAAAVLAVWLRPDPLLLARALDAEHGAADSGDRPGDAADPARPATVRRRPGVPVGALVMVLTQLIMVAIMTMTPVHMRDHGHGTAAAGLVIALHIGAMYLASPLTGWLVDRYGRLTIAVASGPVLLIAGIVAATAPAGSVAAFSVALALLGLGWNFGLVAGTAIVADAVPPDVRARTQGMVDTAISVAGAAGGMLSGVVAAVAGYPLLAIGGGVLAAAVLAAVVMAAGVSAARSR